MKIILGSASKSRKRVLEENNLMFDVMTPNIDEMAIRTNNYYKLPLLLARAKAEALISRVQEPSIIITADQVTICEGDLHEKPKDETEARIFLNKYSSGKKPETASALVVTNTANGKQAEGVDVVKVHFAEIPNAVIDEFIKHGEPLTKSGGFAVESPILKPYITRIEGEIDSVMGMPIKLLRKLIKQVE